MVPENNHYRIVGLLLLLSFFLHILQHLLAGTLRANNVASLLNESFANHGHFASSTEKAFIVPGQRLEGHKFGATQATTP